MRDPYYGTSGPRDARVMLVGESWGTEEVARQKPFVGQSGEELTRMLADAGIPRSEIFLANVCPRRPQNNEMWRFFHPRDAGVPPWRGLHPHAETRADIEALYTLVREIKPACIIACGNYALWALTDSARMPYGGLECEGRTVPSGISSYRGSQLRTHALVGTSTPVLPILHPAAILRDWPSRFPTVHDLRVRIPLALSGRWELRPPPSVEYRLTLSQILDYLAMLYSRCERNDTPLAVDLETRRHLITCLGIADGPRHAISIPFIRKDSPRELRSRWTTPEEVALIRALRRLLTHPRVRLVGQNFLYDLQYLYDHWGIRARTAHDTMLAQNTIFPGTQKDLGYLSSLYCAHHRYWKEDSKEWDGSGIVDELLLYNGEDCWRTFEVMENQLRVIRQQGLDEQWAFELQKYDLALDLMFRGILVDARARSVLAEKLVEASTERRNRLLSIIPQPLVDEIDPPAAKSKRSQWPSSPTQQKAIFSRLYGLPIPYHRKTGAPTLGKEGLAALRDKAPWLSPVFDCLLELRQLGVYLNTFALAPVDPDGRMRCSFGITETFRWTSSENVFGRGTNLQNLPMGTED